MYREDLALLERWHTRRDAEAFDALVSRYAAMVFATCKRILRNASDAEEVAQECFLQLAGEGDRVTRSLGGWLHRTATRNALNRLKQDQRRRRREHIFAEQQAPRETPPWNEIHAHVDEALNELPDATRDLVVAHFLCRMTHDEIAAERGIPRRTVSYRIERGVAEIRETLRTRGMKIGAAALTSGLVADAAAAAPPTLAAALARIGIAGIASTHGTPPIVGGLVLMNAKLLVPAACAVLLAATGLYRLWPSNEPTPAAPAPVIADAMEPASPPIEQQTPPPVPEPADPEVERPAPTSPPDPDPGWIDDPGDAIAIAGFVTDANGSAIADAQVEAVALGFENVEELASHFNEALSARTSTTHRHFGITNRDGHFEIGGNRHAGHIIVNASREGYTPTPGEILTLRLSPGSSKEDVFITLRAGGVVLHGRVVDAMSHRPVADAQVLALTEFQPVAQADSRGRFSITFSEAKQTALQVVSDAHGRATFSNVATNAPAPVTLEMPTQAALSGVITENGAPSPGMRVLLNGAWMTQHESVDKELRGRSAGIGFGYEAATDEHGAYRIADIDPGQEYTVTLLAPDRAPIVQREALGRLEPASENTWNYDLNNLATIQGVVYGSESRTPLQDIYVNVLKNGLPIKEAAVPVDADGSFRIRLSDAKGEFRVYAVYLFSDAQALADRYGKTVRLEPGDAVTVDLTLPDPWTIRARVVNDDGEPVPIDSIVVNVPNQATEIVRTNDANGVVTWSGTAPGTEAWISVSALGYTGALASVRDFHGAPGAVYDAGDLVLYRTSAGIQGVVATRAGQPVANAAVRISAHYGPEESVKYLTVNTNQHGQFTLMDGVPVTTNRFSLEAQLGETAFHGETGYFSIAPDTLTHIGNIVVE